MSSNRALAALHAVEFCRKMGFNNIILEGDVQQIVMAIKVDIIIDAKLDI